MAQDRGNGLEVRLGDLIFAVSSAIDLICPLVAGHHQRVARIARAIAERLRLSVDERRDLIVAAALHDVGAFSLQERLDLMRFELLAAGEHADAGYRLLRSFPDFERAAEIVRFHHLPWDHRRGEQWRGQAVPLASHVLHLADRASVLPIDWSGDGGLTAVDCRPLAAASGARFSPALVEAFADAAARPGFRREIGTPGDVDLRHDSVLAGTLAEADFRSLGRLFCQLVDYRSRFTATHTGGVAAVAGFLAPLAGVCGAAGRRVVIAAGLHDLGKIAVPSETLDKERPLTREERSALYAHPLHGWRILSQIPGMEEINVWANLHHERLDGSGYPFHARAGEIPLESRIVAVADIFTALTEERPYRRGLSAREATGFINSQAAGGALDRDLVAVIAAHRDQAASVRRLAQESASTRYLAFLEHAPAAVPRHSAA